MIKGRALHFVFKVADRPATSKFFRNILGMKVLRHEEFSEGCEAACNGPYANRWSKTMIGYGPEDTHFVIELTYNYGVTSYEKGNDFLDITIQSKEVLERAAVAGWPVIVQDKCKVLEAPGGYRFIIIDEQQPVNSDPVKKISLASSNIQQSIAYWNGLLEMNIYENQPKMAVFAFGPNQAKLQLIETGEPINRAKAYGRIAFSCPTAQLDDIDKKIREANQTILTPLISLDTPGKASVKVIILADPDGHEICFVGDEGFRELSQVDPEGEMLLDRYIKLDKSRE